MFDIGSPKINRNKNVEWIAMQTINSIYEYMDA